MSLFGCPRAGRRRPLLATDTFRGAVSGLFLPIASVDLVDLSVVRAEPVEGIDFHKC